MMFGTSLALIAQEFQGRERGTALGIWGATTAAAVSIGPLVGGALVDALSWRWIFLVNVPIGLAGARGRAAPVARVARPGSCRRRPPRRGAAVPRALRARLRADPRQRGGLGERL
jgi:MFS family permease